MKMVNGWFLTAWIVLPAIALTAFSQAGGRALVAGFQMHIAKPVELAELILAVRSLVS